MSVRRSGALLPVTSLPRGWGVGDLGPSAHAFVDFLQSAGQSLWQILPLNPTDPSYGNSPYHCMSSFALNPLLISPEGLVQDGLLDTGDLPDPSLFQEGRVAYRRSAEIKEALFRSAYERFRGGIGREGYETFCLEHAHWLDDFALFSALKKRFQGRPWNTWPEALRDRDPEALAQARKEHEEAVERMRFVQYLFYRQWQRLRSYCNERGIGVMGDVPIYVVLDSVDVWVSPWLFKLDAEKRPTFVAGVPPDYFSETGQRWGNPVYQWDRLAEQGYGWWISRIRHNLALYDQIRIDHFRGFVGYWEIPAEEPTAVNGRWVEAPAEEFFHCLLREFPDAPIIAEDLGVITPDVHEVMERFGFPGMKVLVFAFGADLPTNPYAPHNHDRNSVVYTGTHDNNTARGWFEEETTPEDRVRLQAYAGREVTRDTVAWDLIRMALGSVADTSILSMVDVLGLDGEHRMNRPASSRGNWRWRMRPEQITGELASRLREMTELYGRC
jgi:4-alpha-glucanotransferase